MDSRTVRNPRLDANHVRRCDARNRAVKDPRRRARVRQLLPPRSVHVKLNAGIFRRADELQKLGIKPTDALHLAAAEVSSDVFLTCDDRLLNASRRAAGLISIRVENPADWLKEVEDASNSQ